MTRDEAETMLKEWYDSASEYIGYGGPKKADRMRALRERIIDAMTGEDRTEPLAGAFRETPLPSHGGSGPAGIHPYATDGKGFVYPDENGVLHVPRGWMIHMPPGGGGGSGKMKP